MHNVSLGRLAYLIEINNRQFTIYGQIIVARNTMRLVVVTAPASADSSATVPAAMRCGGRLTIEQSLYKISLEKSSPNSLLYGP